MAKAKTQKYPNSFLDKTEEGELIGCKYFSVLNQLKTRVEFSFPSEEAQKHPARR